METLADLAAKGWKVRQKHFPPSLCLAYPSETQTISVTGKGCELNCAHCGGVYLKGMKPLEDIISQGGISAASCLISGGCTKAGNVPIAAYADQLAAMKGDSRFNLHVGLVDDPDIAAIARLADKVSFDFVGDDQTIHEVFGLNRTVADYVACYRKLRNCCKVIPHICIGLHGGEIRGEYRALELLQELGADNLTFIIFTPTKGTRYADCSPPDLEAAVRVLAAARQLFPAAPLHLGCMRPGGRYRQAADEWAVRVGMNTIVNPVPAAVRLAQELGLSIVKQQECCAL
ncbi:hypothetical protein [Acetonema longum]|uniref:Putative radical SAM superfamily protein n=1 Tax=Acetonema longum DSM 6540 TaxID=1009370 RepID=F7NPH9_9FIRM|nr:hypothetical protein [Acetonema longum]EGO62059.1 putative radical SAM superfamily protein [Acetonema longum DSM 6540]